MNVALCPAVEQEDMRLVAEYEKTVIALVNVNSACCLYMQLVQATKIMCSALKEGRRLQRSDPLLVEEFDLRSRERKLVKLGRKVTRLGEVCHIKKINLIVKMYARYVDFFIFYKCMF